MCALLLFCSAWTLFLAPHPASAQPALVESAPPEIDRQLQRDFRAALTEARAWLQALASGVPADRRAALATVVDRVRAADLLTTSLAPERARHLLDHGASAAILERSQRVAALYRSEFDRFYSLADPLLADGASRDPAIVRSALEALAQYLESQIEPPRRTPLAQSVAYRALSLPQKAPQLGDAIVPAYARADASPSSPEDVSAGPETPFTPELLAQARALGQDPIAIFEFVRNQVETEFYHGAMKGAAGTLRDRSGNDVDQASLLIALLRSSGIAARYVRGVAALSGDQALRWTGVSTVRRAAQVLTRGGIPFTAVQQGGTIGSFEIEHTWVEAYVPYSNYRGVALETTSRTWIPLDPSFKTVIVTPGLDPAAMNFNADALIGAYLGSPQTLTAAEFYRKQITDNLAEKSPGTTFEQAVTRRSIQTVTSGLLPNTLPFRAVSVNQELPVLPDGLLHRVRFVVQGESGPAIDVTLPASALVGKRVTLSYIPATIEDQIAAGAYLGIDNTPAYLLKLRPVLKVGGEVQGGGEASLQMGALHEVAIEIQSPAAAVRFANDVLAGSFYAIGFGTRDFTYDPAATRPPQDTEKAAADRLYGIAATYLQRWNEAERDLAGILGVALVRPMLSEVMVGSAYNRTFMFGQPQSIDWRGVFIDADARFAEAVPLGADDTRARDFMRLSGLAGSVLEAHTLEQSLQVDSVSAAKLIQLAHADGIPVDPIDGSNVATLLPQLQTADVVKTDISDAVRQGLTATVPRTDLTRNIWTGIGYILSDPDTGSAGYFISGSLAGGETTEDPAVWVRQQYIAELGHPYQDAPNTEPTAVYSIRKVVVSDQQEGTAGQAIERPLAVWVRDAEGRPVQGADVTFTVLGGGADFAGATEITVQSDYLGIALATPTLGKHTIDLPFYVKKDGDTYATRVGQNIISAKARGAGGDIPLDVPFQLFGYPGPPKAIVKLLGDNAVSLPASAAGTLLARLEDEFGNAVSNIDLKFAVAPAQALTGSLPADAKNMVVYPREPACTSPNPILGECGGVGELSVKTNIFGAGVESILGDTDATKYAVSAATAESGAVPPQTFTLFSSGSRIFGSGAFHAPELTMMRLVSVNDKGQTLDAAKVGTQFPDPLGIVFRLTEDNFLFERTNEPCGGAPPDPPCYKVTSLETVRVRPVDVSVAGQIIYPKFTPGDVVRDKSIETGTVTFTPTAGTGETGAVTPRPGGQYSSRLRVGSVPAVNTVEVDATGHVWVPYLDVYAGETLPILADFKPGQRVGFNTSVSPPLPVAVGTPIRLTFDVFGVRASVKKDNNLLIGPSGGTVKDVKIEYTIEPPAYNAYQADVDLFKVDPAAAAGAQPEWVGLLIGDKKSGDGVGTIFQGTGFDPSKRYQTKLVLNRGSAVEIASDEKKLDAYFAAPFGSDFRARENTAEHARKKKERDLAPPLRDEKTALVAAIQEGLAAAASCPLPGAISQLGILMIEQGSGACFWRNGFDADPVSSCGAFYPQVSDHDYEVFIPNTVSLSGAQCVIQRLTDAAESKDELGDITFFYLPKEELESTLLNIDLPPVPVGSDPYGDLGLGRQTLLLSKILLEGEYVTVPGVNDPAKTPSLDGLLTRLKSTPTIPDEPTGVPRLEGYEQAILQEYAFYKSRAHLRITGPGFDAKSYLYELAQKELRNAAKAAIRAALGRIVADQAANELLFIPRQTYRANGCMTGARDPSHPPPVTELFAKACETFEEHVASTAIQTHRMNLGVFTEEQVKLIYQFYRIKAEPPCAAPGCQTQVVDEAEANRLVGSAIKFIQDVNAATAAIWAATKDKDTPDRAAKRSQNVASALTRKDEAKAFVSRTIEDRIANENAARFTDVPLKLFSQDTAEVTHPVAEIRAASEKIVDVERDASGRPIKNPDGSYKPIFKTKFSSTDNGRLSIFLDPDLKIRECNKRDNYSGFFTYPLNPNDPAVPNFGDLPPPVDLPPPPPECGENPLPELKLTKLVNGQPHIIVAPFTKVKLSHRIQNVGVVAVTGVIVTDLLASKTYGPFSLVPGQSHTFEDTYEARQLGKELIGPSEALGFTDGSGIATAWDSVSIEVVRPPCTCAVTVLKDDPNPYAEAPPPGPPPPGQPAPFPAGTPVSTVMEEGRAYRYYQVVDGGTGQGRGGADVTIRINGQARTVRTDAEGYITHTAAYNGDDPRGLEIDAHGLSAGQYKVEFLSVNGDPATCSEPFWVVVSPLSFTRSLKAGTSVKLEGAFAGLDLNGKEGFGMKLGMKSTPTVNTEFTFGRDVNAEVGVGVKATAAKGRVKFIGEATLASAEVTAGISGSLSLTDSYKFPLPLDRAKALGLGQLLISTELMATTSNIFGPHLSFVLSQLFERLAFSDLDTYRSSYGASTALTIKAGASASLPKLTFKSTPIPQLQEYGIGLGVEGGVNAAVAASFAVAPLEKEFSTGVEYRAGANISGGLDLGKERLAPVIVSQGGQDELQFLITTIDKLKLRLSGGIAGSVGFKTTIDTSHDLLELKQVQVSLSAQKNWGLTVPILQQVSGSGEAGKTNTFEFTVKDPSKLDKAVEKITLIQVLAPVSATPIVGPLLGPVLIGDQIAELITLFDEYKDGVERGNSTEIPFGISGFLEGTGLEGEIALKADASVEFDTEKGSMRKGKQFKLERYDEADSRFPRADETTAVPRALIGEIFDYVKQEIAGLYKTLTTSILPGLADAYTLISQRLSPAGVDLKVVHSAEPAPFDVGLVAYKYMPLAGPVRPTPQNPADVSGPSETPHYGIGGFFQFTPERKVLAAPAEMTIYYEDPEVTSIDESTLAIYRWDTARLDWTYVGGTPDPATNTVKANVTTLGLYTVAPRMPSGRVTFTHASTTTGTTAPETTVSYTSATIRTNTGVVVPDGTRFTVESLLPDASEPTPFGEITTADEDPVADGVQVSSHGGVIQFVAKYPGSFGAAQIVAFATSGTALGSQIVVYP